LLTIAQAAENRRQAIEANEREAREGLMPRRCSDPVVLARVAALIYEAPAPARVEGVMADATPS
jgi:hypothetical protein